MKALDIDAVQAFVLVAELRSFTRAAEIMGSTQSGISLRLKKLEQRLNIRLLDRTPRAVRLSAQGFAFLGRARELIAAHDRAIGQPVDARSILIGVSEHVVGSELPTVLSRVHAIQPQPLMEIRIERSAKLLDMFDAGELDLAVIRRAGNRHDGEALFEDEYGWFGAPDYVARLNSPLRLATVSSACGIRALATNALDQAGIPWVDAFIGSGVIGVAAAISAGIGVAPLPTRMAPPSTIDVGAALGLPLLPKSEIALLSRLSGPGAAKIRQVLAASFRSIAAADRRRIPTVTASANAA